MMRTIELKRAVAKAAVIAACALLPAISSASQDTDAMKVGASTATSDREAASHVYVAKGKVFVKHGKNPTYRVVDKEVIVSDTVINTGDDSAALLEFEDGQIVTMQANSTFLVREYHYDVKNVENSSIIFSMLKGGMRFITGLIGQRKKQAFRLLTPNATLGIRGTEFMVAMVDNSLYSKVQSGKITMTNPGGMIVLGAGQSAVVASSNALASIVSASTIPDGTFSELISIPVVPSDIVVPETVPEPVPEPAPVPEPPVEVSTQAVEPPPEVSVEEPTVLSETKYRSGMALTGKIGTLGLGAELNLGISDYVGARFGINGFTYKYNANSGSVNYDFDLNLQTVSAIADWYPFAGGFRTSGGFFYNGNKFNMTGKPTGNAYKIGNTSYPAGNISSLQTDISFNSVAPYLGIGWGNPVATDNGWGLVTDVGVMFQGSPKIDLKATCTTGCGSLPSDLAIEQGKIQSDLSNFKWWPVASIGIFYQW